MTDREDWAGRSASQMAAEMILREQDEQPQGIRPSWAMLGLWAMLVAGALALSFNHQGSTGDMLTYWVWFVTGMLAGYAAEKEVF